MIFQLHFHLNRELEKFEVRKLSTSVDVHKVFMPTSKINVILCECRIIDIDHI